MKMFLLGMLVMYIAMSLGVWIADYIDEEIAMRKAVPLFYILTFLIFECIPGFIHVIPKLPLCVKYKINPFCMSLAEACEKLNTEKARSEWLATVKHPTELKNWKSLFSKYPVAKEK